MNYDNIFNLCKKINNHLNNNNEDKAREETILLLNILSKKKIQYSPIINALIRKVGLFPYIDLKTSDWKDAIVTDLFKVDVGNGEAILHRDQYRVLNLLLSGDNIALSAPTSFGKSFIIDAFIKITNPKNVAILVPTLSLTDEVRRRIFKKFSSEYKIITTTDEELSAKNIFIFPQERAISYIGKIPSLDILIVDEFYKASELHDRDRSPALIKAIIRLGSISKQKYFLGPNISSLKETQLTKDMKFIKLNFNTVYLKVTDYTNTIREDQDKKSEILLKLLSEIKGKTLIYAGSYSEINKVSQLIISRHTPTSQKDTTLLNSFADWLRKNYSNNWNLVHLVRNGIGVHNGSLHRSLSQLQIRLFEEPYGLSTLISTSSIIEGVNTSSENVIVWKTTGRGLKFTNFDYKNLIGRAGRMFKYFVGNIYILAKEPSDTENQLELPIPDDVIFDLNEERDHIELTKEQLKKLHLYKEEMRRLIGPIYNDFLNTTIFKTSKFSDISKIATSIQENPSKWKKLLLLTSPNPADWKDALFEVLQLGLIRCDTSYKNFVEFILLINKNWTEPVPNLLEKSAKFDIDIDNFFKLERNVTFKLGSLLSDINTLQKRILNSDIELAPFIAKLSSAFLPRIVYQLEEYGLPRMICKKIQNAGIINFEDQDLKLDSTLVKLKKHSQEIINMKNFTDFDKYIFNYFLEGISSSTKEDNLSF